MIEASHSRNEAHVIRLNGTLCSKISDEFIQRVLSVLSKSFHDKRAKFEQLPDTISCLTGTYYILNELTKVTHNSKSQDIIVENTLTEVLKIFESTELPQIPQSLLKNNLGGIVHHSQSQKGDLVFYFGKREYSPGKWINETINHIGFMTTNDKFIHSTRTDGGITTSSLKMKVY